MNVYAGCLVRYASNESRLTHPVMYLCMYSPVAMQLYTYSKWDQLWQGGIIGGTMFGLVEPFVHLFILDINVTRSSSHLIKNCN